MFIYLKSREIFRILDHFYENLYFVLDNSLVWFGLKIKHSLENPGFGTINQEFDID